MGKNFWLTVKSSAAILCGTLGTQTCRSCTKPCMSCWLFWDIHLCSSSIATELDAMSFLVPLNIEKCNKSSNQQKIQNFCHCFPKWHYESDYLSALWLKNKHFWPLSAIAISITVTATYVKQLILHLKNASWSHVTSWGPESIWQRWGDETWRGGSSDTHVARWCVVHPLPVLIILSLGVKEEWKRERGRVVLVVVETSWLTQHPPWTGNRWDPTPST